MAEQAAVDALSAERSAAVGVLRNRYKVAKKAGFSTDEIRDHIRDGKKTAEEVLAYHRNRYEILKAMNDPLGTQWNLFNVDQRGRSRAGLGLLGLDLSPAWLAGVLEPAMAAAPMGKCGSRVTTSAGAWGRSTSGSRASSRLTKSMP